MSISSGVLVSKPGGGGTVHCGWRKPYLGWIFIALLSPSFMLRRASSTPLGYRFVFVLDVVCLADDDGDWGEGPKRRGMGRPGPPSCDLVDERI